MKRDLDLIKAILLHFEAKEDWKNEKDFEIEGYDNELVLYTPFFRPQNLFLRCI